MREFIVCCYSSGTIKIGDETIEFDKGELDKNLANIQKNCNELHEMYKATSKNIATASKHFKRFSDNLKTE